MPGNRWESNSSSSYGALPNARAASRRLYCTNSTGCLQAVFKNICFFTACSSLLVIPVATLTLVIAALTNKTEATWVASYAFAGSGMYCLCCCLATCAASQHDTCNPTDPKTAKTGLELQIHRFSLFLRCQCRKNKAEHEERSANESDDETLNTKIEKAATANDVTKLSKTWRDFEDGSMAI